MPTITEFVANPSLLSFLPAEELFSMAPHTVDELQNALLQKRFKLLLPKITAVSRLAEENGVTEPNSALDITSVCLPHTFYKSYSISDVEKGRFDKLTRWLSALTTTDLSGLDVSKCDSLETWIAAIESQTPIRPLCSSGTSGKISFFPRTVIEERSFIRCFLMAMGGFRDEQDSGIASGEVDFLGPWPFRTGNSSFPVLLRLLRETVYADKPGEHIHTLSRTHWNLDVMWLSARLRAAERKGDVATAAVLKTNLEKIQGDVIASAAATEKNVDVFMHELLVNQRGKRVFLFAQPANIFALTRECEKRGVKPQFDPASFAMVPGTATSKGGTLPDDWLERCKVMFPYEYHNFYGMSECTSINRLCSGGHYHLAPWVYLALLDPDTSQPYPRKGLQTGRLALFDLMAESYWGGLISGDRVTINWDGGCQCGRVGPYLHTDITRYIQLKDDDKITCSKTADAYEKAVEYVLGQTLD